ncbi:MAG: hypothetical protein D6737_12325 [Chloroflexi bacterium]|nr:MAG: hypothetical protein CUN54_01545 [Phototrophicales bacterium]RMF79207.1 MAG: hypothetical protein D6737_12325 [Chloroflexota bacterium]
MLNHRWDYEDSLLYQQERQAQAEKVRLAKLASQNRRQQSRFAWVQQVWRQLSRWRLTFRTQNRQLPAKHKQAYN